MKAFLLAAGHGTRLRPLTDSTPKCLLEIRGRPMLDIWLDRCFTSGISEVLINVHAHAQKIHDFIAASPYRGKVKVSEEPVLLGSAGTINSNRDWLSGDQAFWILYADVLTAVDLDSFRRFHDLHSPTATLGVTEVPDPSRCGVVSVDTRGMIETFTEKPSHPATNLGFSGIMIATRKFLDTIPPRLPVDIGFDVLPLLQGMMAYRISEYLQDIGTMKNYELAQLNWPEARAKAQRL
jgi:mannose-1-phosphate guanylyltransferase